MFNLIVAMDETGGIGLNNKIPWRIPLDLQHFSLLTSNSIVVMGRQTWDSIPFKHKPLKNRLNVVITRNKDFVVPKQVKLFYCLNECVEWLKLQVSPIYIIGGQKIYEWFMEHQLISRIALTLIYHDFKCNVKVNFSNDSLQKSNWFVLLHDYIGFHTLEFKSKLKSLNLEYKVDYIELVNTQPPSDYIEYKLSQMNFNLNSMT